MNGHRSRTLARTLKACAFAGALLASVGRAAADTATIAVAANFVAPFEQLARQFAAAEPHGVTMVSGSTGQLYAQILNGAPFDALLAADQTYAARLAADGQALATSQFTYAVGRLVLFTREPDRFAPLSTATLARSDFRWLAVANPELAPYGLAAKETLVALELWEPLAARLVQGQNIAQTFAMVETRNAELGLVAFSQAIAYEGTAAYVEIPSAYHEPIRQDAILLRRGADNVAATAFLEFLKSPEARATIEAFGYGVDGAAVGPVPAGGD
jgi:molybdate transport system substrate-binding protein